MDIFGLTPVDAALNAAGMNIAQALMEAVFTKGGIGVLAGLAALLLAVWRMSINGKPRYLGRSAAMIAMIILLLIPSREINAVGCIQEDQGLAHNTETIRSSFINYHKVPAVFSFISQGLDHIAYGLVGFIDRLLPQHLKCLPDPYLVQTLPYHINHFVKNAQELPGAREGLRVYVKDHYLPVLTRYLHSQEGSLREDITVREEQISALYTQEEKQQWNTIKEKLRQYWRRSPILSTQQKEALYLLIGEGEDQAVERLVNYIIPFSITTSNDSVTKINANDIALRIIKSMPYVYGAAQMFLALLFPIILMAAMFDPGSRITFQYARHFLWIKTWPLSLACGTYVSLACVFALKVSAHDQTWPLYRPVYPVVFIVVVIVSLILTRSIMTKGG